MQDFGGIFAGFLRDDKCFKLCYTMNALPVKHPKKQEKDMETMLTRNYWQFFNSMMGRLNGSSPTLTLTLPDGTTLSDTVFGATAKPFTLLGAICMPYSNTNYGKSYGTWYGKGRTPATIEDYKLEEPITDGSITITGGKNAYTTAINGDHVCVAAAHLVTNNTGADITVTEIGSFGCFTSGGKPIMMDHTVLETPIIIPARNTITIEYVIKFPFDA